MTTHTCAETLNSMSASWWNVVAHITWQSSLTALVLLALVTLARRRWPAPWRYAILLVALLKFACPPFLPAAPGAFSRLGPRVAAPPPAESKSLPAPVAAPALGGSWMAPGAPSPKAGPAVREVRSESESKAASLGGRALQGRDRATGFHWKTWLMLGHLAGLAGLLGWIGWQWNRLRRRIGRARLVTEGGMTAALTSLAAGMGLKRVPALAISELAESPVALGVIHPTILIPANAPEHLSESELEVILAHELAHFRRGDLWVNWLQLWLAAIWWFNPMLWALSRAIRSAREDCCDDLLLGRNLTSSAAYCDLLMRAAARFARSRQFASALGLGETLHPLGRRFIRIMDGHIPRAHRLSAAGLVLALVIGVVFLPGLRSQTAATAPLPKTAASASSGPDANSTRRKPERPSGLATNSLSQLFDQLTTDYFHNDLDQAQLRKELQQRGDHAVAYLTNKLASPDESPENRNKAAWLLGQWKPAPAACVLALDRALEAEDEGTSGTAAAALRDLQPPATQAIPALMEATKRGNSAAARALARIAPESQKVARLLVQVFSEQREIKSELDRMRWDQFRHELRFPLSEMKTNQLEIERAFLAAYDHADNWYRHALSGALAFLGPQTPEGRAIVHEHNTQATEEMKDRLADSKADLPGLIADIKSPTGQLADLGVLNKLGELHEAAFAAVPALMDYVKNPENRFRASAVSALGDIGPSASNAVPVLVPLIEARQHDVQVNAVWALGRIGIPDKRAIELIKPLLRDGNQQTRFLAAGSLWRLHCQYLPDCVSIVRQMLREPLDDPNGKAYLFGALSDMGEKAKAALPELAACLTNRSCVVRREAVLAIRQVAPDETGLVLPALLSLLDEETPGVIIMPSNRLLALRELGKLGSQAKAAIPKVEASLKDEAEEVRAAARETLARISAPKGTSAPGKEQP